MDMLRRKAKPQLKPPDTLSRYVVTKHAWYKAYKRIFCITPSAIHTQNPERTLVLTNSYSFAGDSDIDSVTLGSDDFEFVISARQDKKVRPAPHLCLQEYPRLEACMAAPPGSTGTTHCVGAEGPAAAASCLCCRASSRP